MMEEMKYIFIYNRKMRRRRMSKIVSIFSGRIISPFLQQIKYTVYNRSIFTFLENMIKLN